MKVYISCMWPGVDQKRSSAGYVSRTRFEQILISKMFMKTGLEQNDLARIWGTSRGLISKILRKWCPRWGEKSRYHVRLQHLPKHFLEVCVCIFYMVLMLMCLYYVCVCRKVNQRGSQPGTTRYLQPRWMGKI